VTLRGASVAVAGGLALALAACSSTGIPAATTSSMRVSVTQTAPSVWSAPDTVSTSMSGAHSTAASGVPELVTLPGLTEDCSAAIRAQLAVNNLFTEALQVPGGSTVTTTATAPTTAAPAGAAGITAARVAHVFGELSPTIPTPLAPALGALRDAAESVVGKAVTEIPAVLGSAGVTDAMKAFGDYIEACEPKATD
jgi:hypothetical protein